ncbi:AAA family ATPase [Aliarcobacter butzleri]|uniref:AAA family ATPase n=1 Tax=Aliarcobacter butzleri TaxID=28197 RepID=UPI00126A67D1|nr:AAA family ATPase [Aliarcobacter butzleri]
MLKIKKSDINSFKNSNTIGTADISTHKFTELKYNMSSSIPVINSFKEQNPNSNGIHLDTNDSESIAYKLYCVKAIKNAEENDFFIGYNGTEYIFGLNENMKLLTKIVKSRLENSISDLDERYTLDNMITKELKFLLSKIDITELEKYHNEFTNFKNNNQIKKEVIQKVDETKKVKIENDEVSRKEPNKTHYTPAVDNQSNQGNQIQQVVLNTQSTPAINPDRLAEIEKLKLMLGKEALKEKETTKKLNFCNTILPKQKNENQLVTALREVGGRKVICCYGPHGTGKTYSVEKYAQDLENYLNTPVNFFSFLCEKTMDKSDIVGTPLLKDDSFSYQKMAEAFMSARDGDLTVLLIDEFLRLKEKGVLFNLFGESHYKLDTGRQLEIVELLVNDIDGNPKTAHFCLLDKKDLNPDLILEQANIKLLKNGDDEIFKRLSVQKIKDKLSLGQIPIIDRRDYKQYNLEALKVSSFFTSEVIKAPIENLTIVLATNVGKDYITHAQIDDDLAFLSRLHLVEMKPPILKEYILKIEQELNKAKEKGYIIWNNGAVDVDKEIKNIVKIANDVYSELFKLIKQKSFSSSSYFSYRTFEEFAHTICKQEKITTETIQHCFLSQEKAIMPHVMTNNSRVATDSDVTTYRKTIEKILGITAKNNDKNLEKEANNEITR